MKTYGLLIGAWLTIGTSCVHAQTTTTGKITTEGSCSPVVVQPKGAFQIICKDPSLTRAEATKQAQQIAELLSRLRASSDNNEEMAKRLDTILKDLDEIKAAATPRHLSAEQREAIVTAMTPYRGSVIQLMINMGDTEGGTYANEFASAFYQGLGCDEKACGVGAGYFPNPVHGFYGNFNPDDMHENKIPPQCIALANVLAQHVTSGQPIPASGNKNVGRGTCQLIIGTK